MRLAGRTAALALLLAATAAGAQTRPETAPLAYALPGRPSIALVPANPVRAAVPWYRRDEVLHAGISFLSTLSAQYVLTDKGGLSQGRALPLSAGGTLALGLAKEVGDSRRAVAPEFSWRDLAWDAVGVAAGVAVAAW